MKVRCYCGRYMKIVQGSSNMYYDTQFCCGSCGRVYYMRS